MVRFALLGLFALVAACTHVTPAEQQRQSRWSAYATVPTGVPLKADTSAKNSPKYICVMETEVGSHIPERICRPVTNETELAEKQKRDEVQNKYLELQRPHAFTNGN